MKKIKVDLDQVMSAPYYVCVCVYVCEGKEEKTAQRQIKRMTKKIHTH